MLDKHRHLSQVFTPVVETQVDELLRTDAELQLGFDLVRENLVKWGSTYTKLTGAVAEYGLYCLVHDLMTVLQQHHAKDAHRLDAPVQQLLRAAEAPTEPTEGEKRLRRLCALRRKVRNCMASSEGEAACDHYLIDLEDAVREDARLRAVVGFFPDVGAEAAVFSELDAAIEAVREAQQDRGPASLEPPRIVFEGTLEGQFYDNGANFESVSLEPAGDPGTDNGLHVRLLSADCELRSERAAREGLGHPELRPLLGRPVRITLEVLD
jgi:hypothetical protein